MIDIKILLLCIVIVLGLFFLYKYFSKDSDDENTENIEQLDDDMSEPQYDVNELRENDNFEDEIMDNSQLNDENKETTNNIVYRRKKNN